MPKTLLLALAILLTAAILPAGADEPATSVVDCGPDQSREILTAEGDEVTVGGPLGYPDAGAVRDETDNRTVPWRNAELHYRTDIAPHQSMRVTFTLTWDVPGDFDLHIINDQGFSLGVSENENTIDDLEEQVTVTLRHCQDFQVQLRNYAGAPGTALTLTMETANPSGSLTCVESDPAPACAGKNAGEEPEPSTGDARTHHYLAGTPGQASMVHDFAGEPDNPFRPATTMDRPDGFVPNSYTRPVGGFRDQYRNPFIPWFPVELDGQQRIAGDVSALVYVSSATLAGDADAGIEPGTLFFDLFGNGGLLGTVEVSGTDIRDVPTPVLVTFEGIDRTVGWLDLQIATEPAASSNGVGEPADATHTVWYDSVQFPSRVTLP